ncbi:MAG: hypothetical protein NUV59_01935 [Patescibacteria group bacterium]|nr:hypothetical protein [Patescibacteria group bacterium]
MKRTRKAIISIAAGGSQERLLQQIRKRGFAAIGVDRNRKATGFKYCDARVVASTHYAASVIKKLEKLKSSWDFSGIVVQSSGEATVTAAKVARHFDLRYVAPDVADIVVHKDRLMKELHKRGVPAPKAAVISKGARIKIGFPPPYFVKPSLSFRSHSGMSVVESAAELQSAVRCAIAESSEGKANVEQFIHGVDILTIDWVSDGKLTHVATIEELNSGPPHYYGLGWRIPANRAAEEAAAQLQKRYIKALGIDNALVETAMKYDGKRARMYEGGLDLGGDGVPEVLLPMSIRYDLIDNGISLAVENSPQVPTARPIPTYLRFLLRSDIKKGGKNIYTRIRTRFGGARVDFKGLIDSMDNETRAGAVVFRAKTVTALRKRTDAFEKWLKDL